MAAADQQRIADLKRELRAIRAMVRLLKLKYPDFDEEKFKEEFKEELKAMEAYGVLEEWDSEYDISGRILVNRWWGGEKHRVSPCPASALR